jgi:hypothetical protein
MAAAGRLQGKTGIQAIAPIKPTHYRQVAAELGIRSGPWRRESSGCVLIEQRPEPISMLMPLRD